MRIIHDELGKFQANGIEMSMTESAPSYFWPLSYILLSVGEARVHILLFPWLGVNKCLCFWGTHTTVWKRAWRQICPLLYATGSGWAKTCASNEMICTDQGMLGQRNEIRSPVRVRA